MSVCEHGDLPEAVQLGCGPCIGVAFPALKAWPRALQVWAWVGRLNFFPFALFDGLRTCECSVVEARVEDPRCCLQALGSGPNVEYIYPAQVVARQ